MTKDELLDDIIGYITMSGSLPSILPKAEIERIIENDAKPWFFEHHDSALIKEYLYIPPENFQTEEFARYKYVKLPCNVQNVTWLYNLKDRSMFNMGVSAPNLSVNLGISNQPFLSSYTSTVGQLGVYKVIIDSFADQLNQLSKHTLKHDFNIASKDLHILTSMGEQPFTDMKTSLMAEVYTHIPDEDLFELDHFRRYCRGMANVMLGKLLLRYDYSLPGGVKINSDAVLSDGKEEVEKVLTEIKDQSSASSFFIMVKR